MLSAVQHLIDKDKHAVVANVIVQQEAKVAGALSTVQAMLTGLDVERLCSSLECIKMASKTISIGPQGAHQQTNGWSWQDVMAFAPAP